MPKRKRLQIHPLLVKDEQGNNVEVYLTYKEYESIFERIETLKESISELKKKHKLKETKEKQKKLKTKKA